MSSQVTSLFQLKENSSNYNPENKILIVMNNGNNFLLQDLVKAALGMTAIILFWNYREAIEKYGH